MKRFAATIILTLFGGALLFIATNTSTMPQSGTAIFDPFFRTLGSFGTFLHTVTYYALFYGFFPALIVSFLSEPESVALLWLMVLFQSALLGLFIDFLRHKYQIVRRSPK